ncbi:MAG: TIGR02646 family protein [Candidatus Coatesbacteria bacterium]|nr:TIGR02646 family protein [Candidatus Coatesbacteria bacterium]
MKFIIKQQEPIELSEWKTKKLKHQRKPWKKIPIEIKVAVREALKQEQGFICCYCECRISSDNDCHVEHLRPQSKFPALALAYDNMLASCQQDLEPEEPARCGTKKADWFDESLVVSPLDESCENRFKFNDQGDIAPADSGDDAARETIDKLALNIDWLRARRKKAIREALNDESTPDQMRRPIDGFQHKDENGRFEPFCFAIIQILHRYLGNLVTE